MESTATLAPGPAPERRRGFNPLRAIGHALLFVLILLRVLVRKLLLLFVLLLKLLGRNKSASVVGVALLALLLWSWGVSGVPWAPPAPPVSAANTSAALGPPSPFMTQYIQGRMAFDAQVEWESYTDEWKQYLTQRGEGLSYLTQQYAELRRSGIQITDETHAATYRMNDGRTVYLYIETVKTPQGLRQAPYTFTTAPNGKILTRE